MPEYIEIIIINKTIPSPNKIQEPKTNSFKFVKIISTTNLNHLFFS